MPNPYSQRPAKSIGKPFAGKISTKAYVKPPPSMMDRAKAAGRGAIASMGKLLGKAPTGYGVTTKKKGILRAKDTMMKGK